jgi:hypothetical protein
MALMANARGRRRWAAKNARMMLTSRCVGPALRAAVGTPPPPAALWLIAALAGCGGGPPQLMPTPNVYASGARDLFPDVPPELRNNQTDVPSDRPCLQPRSAQSDHHYQVSLSSKIA